MKNVVFAAFLFALVGFPKILAAQDMPPTPTDDHKWLEQLVGEWEVSSEAKFGPDVPPIQCEGVETVRKVGGFWTVSEMTASVMGNEVTGVMTLGYDAAKKKYVGTWVDSMTDHMWHYVGTLDEAGKVLTLEAEGPNMMAPGKTAKFRDVIAIENKDHKVMTSSMQTEDGKWVQFMKADYKRKK